MSFGFGTAFTRPTSGLIPALQLQFAGAEVLDSRITFTRASPGTRFASTGLMQTMTDNAPRFDYNPATPVGVTGPELNTVGASSALTTFFDVIQPTSGAVSLNAGALRIYSADGTLAQAQNKTAALATPPTVGKTYALTFTLDLSAGVCLVASSDNISRGTYSTSGTYTIFLPTYTSSWLYLFKRQSGITDFTVSNISVREATMSPRGLLIEEARTNLLTYSRDLTNAAWIKTDMTVTRNQVGIDGVANSACLVVEGTLLTANSYQNPTTAVTAGSTITGCFFLKRVNHDWFRIRVLENTGTNGGDAWFNIATGALGTVAAAGTGTNVAASIVAIGGGWYRCCLTATPTGAYTLASFALFAVSANGGGVRVANASYIVDAAQLEAGAFPTSYIPTTTAAATRADDRAQMAGVGFSTWFNQTQGTFVSSYTRYQNVDNFGMVFEARATSVPTSDRINAAANASNDPRVQIVIGGVSQLDSAGTFGVLPVNTVSNFAVAYASGNSAAVRNGSAPLNSVVAFAAPSYTLLDIGGSLNTTYGPTAENPLNGHIRSIKYFNTRLPNATLQVLTL